jgi:ribosome assembly protein YihI (activator of Der GTPase)
MLGQEPGSRHRQDNSSGYSEYHVFEPKVNKKNLIPLKIARDCV